LFKDYQAKQDLSIRQQIITLNLGLVKKEAHFWVNKCSEGYDDLVQIGCLGLIQAIEKYDPAHGYTFSSFAVPYIKGQIKHYLRDKSNSIRIPRKCVELKNKSNKIIKELRNQLNRQPTDTEIALKLEISMEEWEDVKFAYLNCNPISLDMTTGDDEEEGTKLGDLVPDNQYRSFELAQEDRLRIQKGFAQLEENTRQILEFVFLQDLTYRKTAEILGINPTTVSRQVNKGIEKIRKIINSEELK
jgi:RNA polymerase sigma-B factor